MKPVVSYFLLAATMLLLALLPGSWQATLYFDHLGIDKGQYWRLITGHLLHSNYWHLLMNSAGLAMVMLLHGRYFSYGQLALQWLLCGLAISAGLYFFSIDIQIYVGLSGLLHSMLILGAIKDIQLNMTTGWLLLLGIIGKVSWEQWQGPDAELAQLINANVAIDAHLYGVISGLLFCLARWCVCRVKTAQAR
ncbi:rhombosortase [Rheinheimera baltica]|uniref:rhombosortase n=1 Tax=Rheinheimera baltica TaxID=67576 RepID=UPI000407F84C|nr:rhombosortase [Rheinheimera baltica]